MRREAKIGLAVISLLLIVLGVVLYNRLRPATEDGAASAGQEQAGSESQAAPAANQREPSRSSIQSDRPTILTATVGSDDDPEQAPSPRLGYWGTAADSTQAEETGAGIADVSSPPSFADDAKVAVPSGRYGGYAGTGSSSGVIDTWSSGQADSAGSAEAKQPYDSFNRAGMQEGMQAESEDDLAGTSQSTDSAGPDFSGAPLTPIRPPDAQQQSDRYASSSPWPTPLLGQDRAADATGSAGSPGPDWRGGGFVEQESEPAQGQAGTSPMPRYGLGPRRTYRTTPEPSGPAPQADASGENPWATDVSRQPISPPPLVQSDSEPPQLLTDRFAPVGSSRQSETIEPLVKTGTYVVQPNDNYWVISRKRYGTGAYFRALAEHNRAKFPDEDRLRVGDEILTPDASQLEKAYPELCPKPSHRQAAERRTALASTRRLPVAGRIYTVQQGDTLFDIARYELGKASRWAEILELNRDVLGDQIDYLTPGMKLILPDEQAGGTVTRRPGSLFQR